MKIRTDVTTLSRLYPLFEDAGIEGILSGDFDNIKDLTYPELCGKLLKGGRLAEICEIISGSETDPETGIPWGDLSREGALGVVVPFFIDITIGPLELNAKPVENQALETPF